MPELLYVIKSIGYLHIYYIYYNVFYNYAIYKKQQLNTNRRFGHGLFVEIEHAG